MTFIYTPPAPVDFSDVPEHAHVWGYTESQLRAEVERVRRETVEACAKRCIELDNPENSLDYRAGVIWCVERIRSLK